VVDTDLVLEQFGKNRSQSKKRYREFILEGAGSGHQQRFYEVKDQRFLGDEKFVQEIEKEKRDRESAVYEIPIGVIAGEVSQAFGIAIDRLYSLTYERPGAYGRGVVAYLARELGGWLVKEIAVHFRRSPMRISQVIIEVEKRLREDSTFRKIVEKVEKDLIKQGKRKYFITIA